MSELRQVPYAFRHDHAVKMRNAANKLAKQLDTDCIEVALYLHNLADKIDDAFALRCNVVPIRRDGPESAA